MSTVESRVATALTQKTEELEIAGNQYQVAPPTVKTIVVLSAAISQLPQLDLDKENIACSVLKEAKHCGSLGESVAIMLLGADGLSERRCRRFMGIPLRWYEHDRKSELADELIRCCSPRELLEAFVELLERMELASFFELTISLQEINHLKPTREVD